MIRRLQTRKIDGFFSEILTHETVGLTEKGLLFQGSSNQVPIFCEKNNVSKIQQPTTTKSVRPKLLKTLNMNQVGSLSSFIGAYN